MRDAREGETASIHKIYAHYVLNGLATFEEVPTTVEDMCSRREIIQRAGLPYLVAEVDEQKVGYGCTTVYRPDQGRLFKMAFTARRLLQNWNGEH